MSNTSWMKKNQYVSKSRRWRFLGGCCRRLWTLCSCIFVWFSLVVVAHLGARVPLHVLRSTNIRYALLDNTRDHACMKMRDCSLNHNIVAQSLMMMDLPLICNICSKVRWLTNSWIIICSSKYWHHHYWTNYAHFVSVSREALFPYVGCLLPIFSFWVGRLLAID